MVTRIRTKQEWLPDTTSQQKEQERGGLVLTIKDNIKVKHEDSTEYKSFEHAIWNISHKSMPTFTVVPYFTPHPLVKTLQMLHLLINSQTSLQQYKPNTIT